MKGVGRTLVVALVLVATGLQAQTTAQRQREAAARKAGWTTSLSTREIEKFNGGPVHSVHFFNRHVGWAVGRGKATMLLKTTDGGENWERFGIFDDNSHESMLNAVRFWDANHGWITGTKALLRTTDGGETWEPVSGVEFFNALVLLPLSPEVVMVGTQHGEIWLTSRDGSSVSKIGQVTDTYVSGLALVAPNKFYATHGWRHGSTGGIYRSTDGGETWEPVVEGDKPILAIAFRGEKRGVAVGVGVAYVTNDGGDTWKRVIANGWRQTVAYLDDNTLVSTGKNPGVSISRDGGRTWRPHAGPPTEHDLIDVSVVDPGRWVVAGGTGVEAIFRFDDPGYVDEIAETRIPIPGTMKLPDGTTLPPGMYDASIEHRGDEHVITLERASDVPADSATAFEAELGMDTTATTDSSASGAGGAFDPAKCNPCEATVPLEVEYEVEEITPQSRNRPRISFKIEPTVNGFAIVADIAVSPPRDASLTLAALGVKEETEVDASAAKTKVTTAAKKASSWRDRLKKAASGDVAGAAGDVAVNPQGVAQRVKAAKQTTPPAMYRLKVRYPIQIFGRAKNTTRATGNTR